MDNSKKNQDPVANRNDYAKWIAAFEISIKENKIDNILDIFSNDCYWRDILSFTWNIHTARGKHEVRELLEAQLIPTEAKNFALVRVEVEQEIAIFEFSTAKARGKGIVRLRDGKCWSLFTAMEELIGFEEPAGHRRPRGATYGISRDQKSWMELRQDADATLGVEVPPYCLIVGGSQGGLALGARLKRLGVPTIIVDSHPRVGDAWRKRYDSLCLHDPVWLDHLPYLQFPDDWPVYTPKDKMADWLEAYAKIMELNVWTSTVCQKAVYDADKGTWTVELLRGGESVTLAATHLVLATGLFGRPELPNFARSNKFSGEQYHSSAYVSGSKYKDKKCVVIGSNTSAHDICADLWKNGADVTMVQRSSTYVATSSNYFKYAMQPRYSEEALARGIDTDTADHISASRPYGLLEHSNISVTNAIAAADADILSRLKDVGFLLNNGEGGTGLSLLYLRRGSGYYIDVGASELIANGAVKLRAGVGVSGVTEQGLILSDESELDAELIVYATGYGSMTDRVAELISEEGADKVGKIWGYGSDTRGDPGPWEGELRNMWKPTKQEGLWFQAGSLTQARYYSKFLALQIKARMEGLDINVFKLPEVSHLR